MGGISGIGAERDGVGPRSVVLSYVSYQRLSRYIRTFVDTCADYLTIRIVRYRIEYWEM